MYLYRTSVSVRRQSILHKRPTSAPPSVPLTVPVQVRIVSVEIRDAANNKLVTSIEILSPANKREPGLSHFQAKRDELRVSDVHVLEIDLLQRGTRPWPVESLPPSPYLAALMRASHLHAEVWPIGLRERLPILPVPLRSPDPDVPLDVQSALVTVYDEARYALDHQLCRRHPSRLCQTAMSPG